ncbi:MAG: hypothetical protein IPJ88_08500 [Myxococcales bacterium]|nr:MAG: hypothetical protein IPJ88_08500 [Myxococcales bacterium]
MKTHADFGGLMWWECSECGKRVEGNRPERTCNECGLGGVYMPVHGFASHAPDALGFAESWFDSGVAHNQQWKQP